MASAYQMPVDVVCEDGFVPEYKPGTKSRRFHATARGAERI